jgi:hypothetical protein
MTALVAKSRKIRTFNSLINTIIHTYIAVFGAGKSGMFFFGIMMLFWLGIDETH